MGLDGTGKSTVVHLASYIALCEIMRLKLHKNYDMSEFRDDLKDIFIQSGVKGIKTVFLLADSDIVKVSVCCVVSLFFSFSFPSDITCTSECACCDIVMMRISVHARATLAGKESLTSGLLLGRSEVLRSLRHYLRAQSQGRHTINRLEERGVEREGV